MSDTAVQMTTKKDWSSDQEVRWCPGCGDYGILLAVQQLMPELGVAPENTVFISGIGCACTRSIIISSRACFLVFSLN